MKRLFRDITVLLLAGLFAGCEQGEILTDVISREGNRQVIGFVGGYIDAPVKSGMTELSEHMQTMGVYGWQSCEGEPESPIFTNQKVTYNDSLVKWQYNPEKYWDDNTAYRFYAYAPHTTEVSGASVSIDSQSHFSISGITLKGDNVMNAEAKRSPMNNFSSVDDIDWLIDRDGQTGTRAELSNVVRFDMKHLLAKLTIKMRTVSAYGDSLVNVRLDSMSIGRFAGKADFKQLLNHTPSATDPSDTIYHEWTVDPAAPLYSIESSRNTVIDGEGIYVVESLMIPQQVTDAQTVDIHYSLQYQDGYRESVHHRFALDEKFDSFMGGCNYNLTISVGQETITFESGVSGWDLDGTGYVERTCR